MNKILIVPTSFNNFIYYNFLTFDSFSFLFLNFYKFCKYTLKKTVVAINNGQSREIANIEHKDNLKK